MKTYLFILIIGQSATTLSTNDLESCIKLQEFTTIQAKKNNVKDVQHGCFEELGGRKKDL